MTTAIGIIIFGREVPIPFLVSQEPGLNNARHGDLEITHAVNDVKGTVAIRYKGIGKPVLPGEHKIISIEGGQIWVEITHHGSPEAF